MRGATQTYSKLVAGSGRLVAGQFVPGTGIRMGMPMRLNAQIVGECSPTRFAGEVFSLAGAGAGRQPGERKKPVIYSSAVLPPRNARPKLGSDHNIAALSRFCALTPISHPAPGGQPPRKDGYLRGFRNSEKPQVLSGRGFANSEKHQVLSGWGCADWNKCRVLSGCGSGGRERCLSSALRTCGDL